MQGSLFLVSVANKNISVLSKELFSPLPIYTAFSPCLRAAQSGCLCLLSVLSSMSCFPNSAFSLGGARHQSSNITTSDSNRSDVAVMSVPRHVESYSRRFALAAEHNRTWVFSPVQTQTTPFQWRDSITDIASKCPCFERFTACSQKQR